MSLDYLCTWLASAVSSQDMSDIVPLLPGTILAYEIVKRYQVIAQTGNPLLT